MGVDVVREEIIVIGDWGVVDVIVCCIDNGSMVGEVVVVGFGVRIKFVRFFLEVFDYKGWLFFEKDSER